MNDIPVKATIEGQVRIRRKLCKSLFFIDIQPSNNDAKSQVLFRADDDSLDVVAFQDAFRACRPGQIIRIQVGDPLDPSEQENKEYKVWQSNKPVEVIKTMGRDAFIQDRPLGSETSEAAIRLGNGEKVAKSKLVCKYWINKNVCQRGTECLFQHPTGDAFETARKEWLEQREKERKMATFDPNDPHSSKKPHGLRALIFADWIRKTFHDELKDGGGVLDVAGGKGEISMVLSRGFGIPSTVVEPQQRKLAGYWYTRLRRLLYRFETGDLAQPDWKNENIQIDLKSWPHETQPNYLHTYLDDHFLEQQKELLEKVQVFVGLHSDQATIPIVEAALKAKKAFAVVPCCVFSHDNRSRHLKSGELVTTTEQQIQYICEKDTHIQTAYLDFEGKNRVVYWKPQAHNKNL